MAEKKRISDRGIFLRKQRKLKFFVQKNFSFLNFTGFIGLVFFGRQPSQLPFRDLLK